MKILVYRIGFLGDTIVALPALWAIRAMFPSAQIHYLSEKSARKEHVRPESILPAGELVARFISYPAGFQLRHIGALGSIWLHLARERYDALAYLAPQGRTAWQMRRDIFAFRTLGITRIFGRPVPGKRVIQGQHEADYLLQTLADSGVTSAVPGAGRMDLCISARESAAVEDWLAARLAGGSSEHRLIAVGPGSKMPAKIWPKARFEALCQHLVREGFTPVILGGSEDAATGRDIVSACGAGIVAAGELNLRMSCALLTKCLCYVGNDTGTMHLAAASGVHCVGIFASRDVAGRWNPYGGGHIVLRRELPCSGCLLTVCPRDNECLKRIGVADVLEACRQVINAKTSHRECSS